jgi:hypothetical protein
MTWSSSRSRKKTNPTTTRTRPQWKLIPLWLGLWPRLVRGTTIPLEKVISITGNRRRWNGIAIFILLFGCNTGI